MLLLFPDDELETDAFSREEAVPPPALAEVEEEAVTLREVEEAVRDSGFASLPSFFL